MEWEDDHIIDRVQSEVGKILGIQPDPSFVHLIRHRTGIPQYEPGHAAWLAEVEKLCSPGLHLTGWGYRGVGVGHIAADATRVSGEIADQGSS
jgi:oxygen-dependent protoporphyrinogen oxidase